MATVIFWGTIVLASIVAFHRASFIALHCILGVKKVKGKLVNVAPPEHYMQHMIVACYWLLAFIACIAFYTALAYALDVMGLVNELNIYTGFHTLRSLFF